MLIIVIQFVTQCCFANFDTLYAHFFIQILLEEGQIPQRFPYLQISREGTTFSEITYNINLMTNQLKERGESIYHILRTFLYMYQAPRLMVHTMLVKSRSTLLALI